MKFEISGDTLRVSGIGEQDAESSATFREQTGAAFTNGQRNLEIDLSDTPAIDICVPVAPPASV